jgi:nitroreductase
MMTATEATAATAEPLSSPRAYVGESEGALREIYERRAVRAYTDQSVTRENVELLLDAAVHAPSAVNSQPWAFVVLQDRELLARYAESGTELLRIDPPGIEVVQSGLPDLDRLRQMASGADFKLFHGAPTLIVIYARRIEGLPDCFLAAQNLMLAAQSLGLGTCPIGMAIPLFNRAEVKAELTIPPDWSAALPIVVGWPAGETAPSHRHPALIAAWR